MDVHKVEISEIGLEYEYET